MKVRIFGGFPVENPTKKANRLEALLRGISLSEYGSEGFRVRLRRLSEYGSVACLIERRAEQYSDTVLEVLIKDKDFALGIWPGTRAHLGVPKTLQF